MEVSSPIDLLAVIEATQDFEVPEKATGGPRLVIRVRRVSIAAFDALRGRPQKDQDRETARLGLVAPRVRFSDEDPDNLPAWEDLPLAVRLFIAGAVLDFTTAGTDEVMEALRPFRDKGGAGEARPETATGGNDGSPSNEDRGAPDQAERDPTAGSGEALPLGEVPV